MSIINIVVIVAVVFSAVHRKGIFAPHPSKWLWAVLIGALVLYFILNKGSSLLPTGEDTIQSPLVPG